MGEGIDGVERHKNESNQCNFPSMLQKLVEKGP